MSLKVGIVGLPNVGKSTVFNALTHAGAAVASYPFTTIDPNLGVVPVPDQRLVDIADIVKPEKVVPATIEFVDLAGLVKGAHKGEGLGNQFLGHIRAVDAIVMVVRCFRNPDVPHVTAELDPRGDIEVINLELILADLAIVERRIEKVRPMLRSQPREYQSEWDLLERLHAGLQAGQPARRVLGPAELAALSEVALLTDKPIVYLANVGEEDLPDGGPLAEAVREAAAEDGAQTVVMCAQLEAELMEWPAEEARAYREELGLRGSALERLVWAAYELLGLVTFFTTTGGKVARAWTVPAGTPVRAAAGKIHTDMERGFIRAEVISYPELMRVGDFHTAREKGLIRVEGKDYPVQDGDIIHIRFAV